MNLLLGRRLGRGRYVGRCTRTHHLAVLRSGKGTYCFWHRLRVRRFQLDQAGDDWYWREPGQMPYQHGPFGSKLSAWLAAWRATR